MLVLGTFPGTCLAVRINYDFGLSILHSDNIGLDDTGGISDTVFSPRLNFDAEQTGSTVQLKLAGNLEYLHYQDHTFADEPRGELSGQFNWNVVPQRVDFVVKDYLTRQSINTLASFNPGNQQQVNVFIAGPSFYARFGEAMRGQLDLRYTNSYAEKTREFNGNRYNVAGRLLRDIDPTTAISANVEATRVDYRVTSSVTGSAADYDRYDAYVGFARKLASLDLGVDAGYSWLDRDGRRWTSPKIRADLTWRPTARGQFDGVLNYQFGDTAQDVVTRAGELDNPLITDYSNVGLLVSPAVFRQRRIELGYQFSGERVNIQVRPYFQRIRYVDGLDQDQTQHGGYLQFDYTLRPRLTLSLAAAREDRRFDSLARRDKDSVVSLALSNQFTRHWSWRVDLQHRERNSSDAGQGYDENATVFTINYRR